MKHFLLLSIFVFQFLTILSQGCDGLLSIFLEDTKISDLSEEILVCENDSSFLSVTYELDGDYFFILSTDTRDVENDFIQITESGTYYFNVKEIIDGQEMPVCTENIVINFTQPIDVSFEYSDEKYLKDDTIYICTKDSFLIHPIPDVLDAAGLNYNWMLNTMPVDSNTLVLYSETASMFEPNLVVTDSTGCILYNDTLIIKTIQPPSAMFNTTNAATCNGNGSVSFNVDNPNQEFNVSYQLNAPPSFSIQEEQTLSLAIGGYNLKILYNELETCYSESTFSISFEDAPSIEFDLPKTSYCVGDSLIINSGNDDRISSKSWYLIKNSQNYVSGIDSLEIVLPDSLAGELLIKLLYYYDGNICSSEYVDTITVNSTPIPQIMPNLVGTTICQSDSKMFTVEGEFSDYLWTLNKDTISADFLDFNPSQLQYNNYSVTVTDGFGCVGFDLDSVYIVKGIDVVSPNIVDDNVCEGNKIMYAYEDEVNFDQATDPENNLYENKALKLVEWNSNGSISDQTNSSTCNKVEVNLSNEKAPNGKIHPFGTSNTMVFADSDNSANHLVYQWFYIDLNETAEAIYNNIPDATERIIDCTNFDCLFAISLENEGKILGLEIYDNRNGCTNLIFYDELGFFPGLKEITVSVPEVSSNHFFNLYPNLNQGSFYIKLSAPATNPYNLAIYNALGEIIKLNELNNQSTQKINLPNIKAGIYFAVLKNGNQAIAQQKLIIH